jgi:hypothetical protein
VVRWCFDGVCGEDCFGEGGDFGGEEGVLKLVFGLGLGAAACRTVDVDFRESVLGVEQLAAFGFSESFWAGWGARCP